MGNRGCGRDEVDEDTREEEEKDYIEHAQHRSYLGGG